MKVSAELQKKLDLLDKYDAAYYSVDDSLISDAAYDLFKDSVLRQLPPDHPRLKKVGHVPVSNWPKESHDIMMGSQNKVSDEKAIREWVEKKYRDLGVKDLVFVLQLKIDGYSLEAKYEKIFKGAVTRGNGVIGENITPNAKMFRYLPGVLPVDNPVVVRGEGVLTKQAYADIQKATNNRYKNPRNAASGISRRYDGKFCKNIQVIAYDVNAKVKTEQEKAEVLKKLGFNVAKTYVCKNVDQILKVYREYKQTERDKLPYDIDGLVLKIDSLELQEKLGVKHNRPEGQVALKFDSDQAVTKVKDIALQIGRTGKVTPVAILEPVELMGSTIQKATLHNFAYIEENFIGIGAEVTIEKKGDIIPQVVDIVAPGDDYKRPTACPSCGGSLEDDSVNMWCRAPACREREINRITYWVKTLDMRGFSGKFIEKLWDMGSVQAVSDLYNLTPDDFATMDGIGAKTVKGFFKTLKGSSEMYLEKFITALGIPSCSKSTAEVLVQNYKTWEEIVKVKPMELAKLPGFADVSSTTICAGIEDVSSMAADLLKVIKIKEKKKGVLTGKSFCVTGSLKSMGRKEFQEMVVDNGGTTKNSVSEGLTYLVTNDPGSGSRKNRDAKKYGVEIITEDGFFKLLGKAVSQKDGGKNSDKEPEPTLISENIFD